ncbi:MAG TPA: hypothetical protein VD967_01785 [Candidatus Paceibacterota bacterium]|nr:hypothetical protein [Candidatus Paceibacterota bacterium]
MAEEDKKKGSGSTIAVPNPFRFRAAGEMPGAKKKKKKTRIVNPNPGTPWLATSASVPFVRGKPPPRAVLRTVPLQESAESDKIAVYELNQKGEAVQVDSVTFEELLERPRPGPKEK